VEHPDGYVRLEDQEEELHDLNNKCTNWWVIPIGAVGAILLLAIVAGEFELKLP